MRWQRRCPRWASSHASCRCRLRASGTSSKRPGSRPRTTDGDGARPMNGEGDTAFELLFEKDVPVPMGDGNVLRANVYRPSAEGRFPTILAMGIYGKDEHFADAFKSQWETLLKIYPDLCRNGSTGRYLRWENVDPGRWVPDGYVVVTVDSP